MNLVLAHCGKEWRAQRGLLFAYSLLVFACLCLGCLLVPDDWWLQEGRSPTALSWFFAAGVIGVFAFAAPNLVRAEFAAKDDQFVRRLPGALAPSFGGKLLFLVLCAAALPLAGLCCGELFLQAIRQPWHELFVERGNGWYTVEWPWPAVVCGHAMLLATWVWAIGTWLPGGRMAVGGVCLFVLLLGIGMFAVIRQSPNIEQGIGWQMWLWAVVPAGAIVAGISWIAGRRGGGAMRSARFGLAVTAVGLVPPWLWLADKAHEYHHPDFQRLAELDVHGLSPDGRFALASGAAHANWCHVKLRIDLLTGAAEQLAGIDSSFGTDLERTFVGGRHGQQRYWHVFDHGTAASRVLDLATGQWTPTEYDDKNYVLLLPTELRARLHAEVGERTRLRAPGGRRVWFENGELCFEELDGAVARQPSPWRQNVGLWPAGHGVRAEGGLFDFTKRQWIEKKGGWSTTFACLVRGVVVCVPQGKSVGQWEQQDLDGQARPCGPLAGMQVLGLFDDDQLLCALALHKKGRPSRLLLYRPADGTTTELRLPEGVQFDSVSAAAPLYRQGSLLERDPAGRIWLHCGNRSGDSFLLLDTVTQRLTPFLPHVMSGNGGWLTLLGWPDARSVLVSEHAQILRIDIATGERTVLFPRR